MSHEDKKQTIKDCFQNYFENPELNGDKLIAKLNNFKTTWVSERDKLNQRVWRNNVLFYAGQHYVRDVFNTTNSYRVRLRENHVNNIVSRILSTITQNTPIVRVFPSDDSLNNINDAKNTESYLKYFWRQKKLEQQLQKMVKYTLIFGNSFCYRYWNPDLGGKIQISYPDDEGGKKEIAEYRGDIDISIDDPFKIAIRPGIEDWKDHYDIIRSVPVSRAMLESKYGEISADPAVVLNYQTGDFRHDDDMVVLNCYYHKPTAWFEEGMYAAWVGDKIIKIRPSTDAESELPFSFLGFDKVPMKFWHLSTIEQIMDLQEQLNRAASMIIEARNLVAKPRVLASNESKIPAQSLTDRPGEIVRYAMAGGAPQFIVPQFNFTELSAHKSDVRTAMQQVSGVTSASRGEVPSATRTALALQLVMENDRSQFLPFINNYHQSIMDIATGILKEAADNIDENDPRVIRIEGKDAATMTFHGGMVPSPLDVQLEDTNPLGWTAAGRIEQVSELVKSGLVKDENKALEMLHLNMPNEAYELTEINRKTQKREIQDLEKGSMVKIGARDDHKIHMYELDKVMASYEFKSKPPMVQAAYLEHYTQHENMLMQAMQGQAPVPPQQGIRGGMSDKDLMGLGASMQNELPGGNLEALLSKPR